MTLYVPMSAESQFVRKYNFTVLVRCPLLHDPGELVFPASGGPLGAVFALPHNSQGLPLSLLCMVLQDTISGDSCWISSAER